MYIEDPIGDPKGMKEEAVASFSNTILDEDGDQDTNDVWELAVILEDIVDELERADAAGKAKRDASLDARLIGFGGRAGGLRRRAGGSRVVARRCRGRCLVS